MAYTTTTLLADYLQRALTTDETDIFPTLQLAVKKWIDRELNTTFDVAVETTRNFEATHKSLDIDACTAVTAITSNDPYNLAYYTYSTFEYVLEPVNETVKREVRLRYGHWPSGTQNIAITAKFSEYDGGVPEDIQIAATRLVGGVINAGISASQGGEVQEESLEGHKVVYSTTSNAINTLAKSDPILLAILGGRKELYIW